MMIQHFLRIAHVISPTFYEKDLIFLSCIQVVTKVFERVSVHVFSPLCHLLHIARTAAQYEVLHCTYFTCIQK